MKKKDNKENPMKKSQDQRTDRMMERNKKNTKGFLLKIRKQMKSVT